MTGWGRYLGMYRLFLLVLRLLDCEMAPGDCSVISLHHLLVASWALHVLTAASRVRVGCQSSCSTVSPLVMSSIIWSLMLFCVHSSEQKLHVLASSHKATR